MEINAVKSTWIFITITVIMNYLNKSLMNIIGVSLLYSNICYNIVHVILVLSLLNLFY